MDNTIEKQILFLVDEFIETMIELHNAVPGEEQRLYKIAEDQLLELTDKALLLLGGREQYLEPMLSQLIAQKLPQGAIIDSFGDFKEELDRVLERALEVYHECKKSALEPENSCSAEEGAEEGDSEEADAENNDFDDYNGELVENAVEESDEELAEMAEEESDVSAAEADSEEIGEAEEDEEESVEAGEEEPEQDPLGLLIVMAFPGEEIIREETFFDLIFDYYLPGQKLAFLNAARGQEISPIAELALRKAGVTVVNLDPESIYNIKSFKRQLRRIQLQKDSDQTRIFSLSAE